MFIEVSKTQAEKERMYEDKCNVTIYSKPVALVKKAITSQNNCIIFNTCNKKKENDYIFFNFSCFFLV